MSLLPAALYGLKVPPGEIVVAAAGDFPATIRITMAAIDPTEEPEADEDGKVPRVPRSTLKILKEAVGDDYDEDDSYLEELLANADEDDSDDDSEEGEEANGGPSDPAKSKKARKEAAIKQLIAAAQAESDSDEDMADGEANGKSKKGKEPATDEDDSDDDDSELGADLEDHVLCTLDVERNFQQPLDIVIGEHEKCYFVVSGTHSVHLTGNYVLPPDDDEDDEDSEDDDYDLPPDMDELLGDDEDISSDDLDEIDQAERVKEIDTDEEEAPKLVKAKAKDTKKGKKRPAEDEAETLDDLIAKDSVKAEADVKLSKKQLKKLKNNKGEAVVAEEKAKDTTPAKGDKKVQFAKNLEQGPTGSAEKAKPNGKATLGVKVVQGVTIDDRKLGQGRTAKSGDKVGMRYIGKLQNGKQFDANKKGPAFTFKLGKGEVIKGWDIGVAGMAVGGERRLTIPASLAYGSSGVPGIPGNSTLIFDVKLVEIK
ncbi:hypothetical protein RB595_009231 [Gaeumannomyces hyphopodioides]